MATLAERYWQELRPSAAVRQDLEALTPARRRPRRERRVRVLVRRGR
jgi:hypothetical protein